MISSPCSAEQAQRIKLCPRKSPSQSFPPIAQQAPGHFVRGFAVVGRHSPPPKPRGQGPPRMRSLHRLWRCLPCARGCGKNLRFLTKELQIPAAVQNLTYQSLSQPDGCQLPLHKGAKGRAADASPPSHKEYRKPSDISSGGFLHPLFLLLRIQCTLACFCRRLRQSAIMAMNSEFVGLPLMFETV